MNTIPDILAAFKTTLEDWASAEGVEFDDFVADSPNIPSVSAYVEHWPYDFTISATVGLWLVAGTTDMQNAQSKLMAWLSDIGPRSIIAAIDANNTLGGEVSSVLPLEIQNFGVMVLPSGPRLIQARLVCEVLR